MKRWDRWNWAFVTSGVALLCNVIVIMVYRTRLQNTSKYVTKWACGFLGMFAFCAIAAVLLAATGIAWLRMKDETPFVGTAIGMALWVPLLLGTLFVGIAASSVMPPQGAVLVLPAVVLIWGLVRKPRVKRSNQPSERTR